MSTSSPTIFDLRLRDFLAERLGGWPPVSTLEVRPCALRDQPRWDGNIVPLYGVESPQGTLLSYSPTVFPQADSIDVVALEDELGMDEGYITIPRMFGHPEMRFGRAVFRYPAEFVDLPAIGEWVETDDPRLPDWLRPFNGGVLVHWEPGDIYAAGVGLKKHSELGYEIAVGTDPAYRGRGLAQALVAQAARNVWDRGAIPFYQHGTHNAASARVAEKAGFPDRGWHSISMG
ncbi:MAG: GNAT family N-acetyltransferase [Thermomicrobiales bacterium]|nr:GNAT family N-acetyltransferase [Thermomicrobiales bacterium]